MDRGASSAFLTELLKSKSEPCWLVEVYFDDGTIRMTDAWRDIVWGAEIWFNDINLYFNNNTIAWNRKNYPQGNTYVAQGHFLGFSGLSETLDMRIPTVNLSLSAVDQTWIAIALTKQYIDRRLVIYKAFIDYVNGVVSSPVIVFDGRMDGMPISDDPDAGKCIITVSATNQWSDFERRPGRHTNDQEQQILFSGDKFFEFSSQINKQSKWGAA